MYRSFNSLEELFDHMQEDKEWTGANAAQHNRYPMRFILFDNFVDFNMFVLNRPDGIYKYSIDTMIDRDYPDSFLSYTELSKDIRSFTKKVPINDFIIYPFSEMARFYAKSEFDSLVTTIRGEQAPEDAQESHVRLYIPVVGMQGKMSRFFKDQNAFVWEYKSKSDKGTYRLILTDGTTYDVGGLEEKYTVVHNLSEWLRLWEKGDEVKQTIICCSPNIFANAHHAQPDNAFTYVECYNPYEFLTKGLGLDFGVNEAPKDADRPFWIQLASEIDLPSFNFDDYIKERFDTFSFRDGVDFIKAWFDCDTDFDRWLLTLYYRKVSKGKGYINRAISKCQNLTKSELFSNISTLILDDKNKDKSIEERGKALAIAAEQGIKLPEEIRRKLKAKLKAIALDPAKGGYYQAVKLLTPLTNEELQLAIEWRAKDKINNDDIKNIFPSLYYYLQPMGLNTLEGDNMWISEYFEAYKLGKIANSPSAKVKELLSVKNASPSAFHNWKDRFKTVKTVLHNRRDIDVLFWIDGLGVDWIPLIREIVASYGKDNVYLNEIHIAVADLPTTTMVNKNKLQSLLPEGVKLPKIGDIDTFAHTSKEYPQYIIDEFALVEESIIKVLDDYSGKKIAFVSDHGLTYLSQFESGLKLAGVKSDHEGRTAIITDSNFTEDKKYIILDDGKTICSLNHQSLTDKVAMGHGAHGGCTPEEILVPIIIVSSNKNTNEYSVKLINDNVDGTNPKLIFTIKGLNSIDIPTLEYNEVTYSLSNVGGDQYESERLTLVDTATQVNLQINGEKIESFLISVSTGASEDEDLFDF